MLIKAFFSDPHWYHARIIELSQRPFVNVEEMNEVLVSNYNDCIDQNDTVIWLGDAFFTNVEKATKIMQRLNGHKILISGNHDRGAGSMINQGFLLVMDECVMQIAGKICRLSHYPYKNNVMSNNKIEERYLDRRPNKIKGELLLHGHTHSKKKINGTMIHCGVDAWNFRPALMSEIEEIIQKNFLHVKT